MKKQFSKIMIVVCLIYSFIVPNIAFSINDVYLGYWGLWNESQKNNYWDDPNNPGNKIADIGQWKEAIYRKFNTEPDVFNGDDKEWDRISGLNATEVTNNLGNQNTLIESYGDHSVKLNISRVPITDPVTGEIFTKYTAMPQ